jgi:hypothetical protein
LTLRETCELHRCAAAFDRFWPGAWRHDGGMRNAVVSIRAAAAASAKPDFGAPCNGCGLCCLAEPCPAGVVASGRREGACAALRWDDAAQIYRCGLVARAPAPLRWLARRWISAGSGCDADFEVERNADFAAQRGAEAGVSAERGS